jgi:hypothetical protein
MAVIAPVPAVIPMILPAPVVRQGGRFGRVRRHHIATALPAAISVPLALIALWLRRCHHWRRLLATAPSAPPSSVGGRLRLLLAGGSARFLPAFMARDARLIDGLRNTILPATASPMAAKLGVSGNWCGGCQHQG